MKALLNFFIFCKRKISCAICISKCKKRFLFVSLWTFSAISKVYVVEVINSIWKCIAPKIAYCNRNLSIVYFENRKTRAQLLHVFQYTWNRFNVDGRWAMKLYLNAFRYQMLCKRKATKLQTNLYLKIKVEKCTQENEMFLFFNNSFTLYV